jgi:hypothetical protein
MIRKMLDWFFKKSDGDKQLRESLSEHATIMNKYGINSKEEKEFIEKHKENKELMELCETARTWKRILTSYSAKE